MTAKDPSRRADARRNRQVILAAAGLLFAERGDIVQMDEIAARSGLGMGTVYRNFPTKRVLLAAIVAQRFEGMVALAEAAAAIEDPAGAFRTLVRTYLEAAEADAAFRVALLGREDFDWDDLAAQKAAFMAVAEQIVVAAARAGCLRPDFGMEDFVMLTRGVMANMTTEHDWRRHLELSLDGVRP